MSEPPRALPRPISYRRLAGYTATIAAVVLGIYALYLIRTILFLLLTAVLLATAIEPLVRRLLRGPFSRGQGILIVYTGIMVALVGLMVLTVPVILSEAGSFAEGYPRILQQARELVWGIDQRILGPAAEQVVERAQDPAVAAGAVTEDEGATALTIGLTLVEGLFAGVAVFVVAFYWMTERTAIRRAFVSIFAREHRAEVGAIWNEIERVLGGWVRGQLLLMLFIGVLTGIGYTLLGLKYALVLALIAALFEIVPLVGPYLGAIPAILVALTQDVRLALVVAVYIVIVQTIEGYVLVPRVMQRTVGVSSLTVILGILIGAALGGIAGALVAVPIAAATQVILRHVFPSDPGITPDEAEAREEVVEAAAADVDDLPLRKTA